MGRSALRWNTEEQELWLEAELDPLWMVAYRLAVAGETARAVEVRVFPNEWGGVERDEMDTSRKGGRWSMKTSGRDNKTPTQGISRQLLRSIPLGHDVRSLDAMIRQQSRIPEMVETLLGHLGVTRFTKGRDGRQGGTKGGRGRPPLLDREYLQVAKHYDAATRKKSRHPARDAAEQLKLTRTTVRARLNRARALGFLEDAGGKGCIGGRLTDAGRRALAKAKGQRRKAS